MGLANSPLRVTIFTTTEDPASQTIKAQLLDHYPFARQSDPKPWDPSWVDEIYTYTTSEGLAGRKSVNFHLIGIHASYLTLDGQIAPGEVYGDILIYASRHRSASGQKSLLCHTTGNLDKDNSFGGSPNRVSCGSGLLNHYLYVNLRKFVDSMPDYSVPVDHEVDHHGPTEFTQPSAFIELGSSEAGWLDSKGGEAIAHAIIQTGIDLAKSHYNPSGPQLFEKDAIQVAIGFGGGHYMPSFQRIIAAGYGLAHTVPKYKVMAMTPEKIAHLLERTAESVDAWVLDWKGMNSQEKGHLMPLLETTGIPVYKTKQLKKALYKE